MNIDLFEVMPGCVFRDADELMQRLAQGSYPQETLDAYRANYLPKNLGTSTAQIAQLGTMSSSSLTPDRPPIKNPEAPT